MSTASAAAAMAAPHLMALPFDVVAFGCAAYAQFMFALFAEWILLFAYLQGWVRNVPRFAGNKTLVSALIMTAPITGLVAAVGTHYLFISMFAFSR